MEQVAGELSRSLYADYGALAMLVLVNLATTVILFRYFSAELKECRAQREQSDKDWRQRYDSIVERMLTQVTTQANTLERISNRLQEHR